MQAAEVCAMHIVELPEEDNVLTFTRQAARSIRLLDCNNMLQSDDSVRKEQIEAKAGKPIDFCTL